MTIKPVRGCILQAAKHKWHLHLIVIVNVHENKRVQKRLVDRHQHNTLAACEQLLDSFDRRLVNVKALHGLTHQLIEVVDGGLDAGPTDPGLHLVELLASGHNIQTQITALVVLGFEVLVERALGHEVSAVAVVVATSEVRIPLCGH